MQISKNHVVSFHYVLTDEQGEELDSSRGGEPLAYLHGAQGIIPGLEAALEGRAVGDAFQANIPPEQAYGLPNAQLVQQVPLEALTGVENLRVGLQLQSQDPSGSTQIFTVTDLNETHATVDANHPLSGKTLNFDIVVDSVRAASEEEISHGHVH